MIKAALIEAATTTNKTNGHAVQLRIRALK